MVFADEDAALVKESATEAALKTKEAELRDSKQQIHSLNVQLVNVTEDRDALVAENALINERYATRSPR